MKAVSRDLRNRAYGQENALTAVDRLGVRLSARRVRKVVDSFSGLRMADIGCGYHATLSRSFLNEVASLLLVDVALSDEVKRVKNVHAIEGTLPQALEEVDDAALDLIVCNSVLEHLWEPAITLGHFTRMLKPGGTALINVPSWRGKRFLEFSAFRLGLSPAEEMQDHKTYYDPRDLWPLLVRGGFRPSDIRCFTHKLGLNTFAICHKARRGNT